MKKYQQGEFEYYKYKTKRVLFLTILYFLISLSLFVAGYIQTHTKANLLTIFAVLGLLPASKSLVSLIMYIRYHGCSKEDYEELKDVVEPFIHGYGFVFTTYKKNFEASVSIVKNGYVYVLLNNHLDDAKELQNHIDDMVKRNGLKGTVGVYSKKAEFVDRLNQLSDKENENEANDKALFKLLCELSL